MVGVGEGVLDGSILVLVLVLDVLLFFFLFRFFSYGIDDGFEVGRRDLREVLFGLGSCMNLRDLFFGSC